jgi:hypothetical protein
VDEKVQEGRLVLLWLAVAKSGTIYFYFYFLEELTMLCNFTSADYESSKN